MENKFHFSPPFFVAYHRRRKLKDESSYRYIDVQGRRKRRRKVFHNLRSKDFLFLILS